MSKSSVGLDVHAHLVHRKSSFFPHPSVKARVYVNVRHEACVVEASSLALPSLHLGGRGPPHGKNLGGPLVSYSDLEVGGVSGNEAEKVILFAIEAASEV